MECPSCYAQVSEGARFCSQCGIALPQRCPACGASNAPNANFCAECGARLTAAIAASWPPERRPSETPPEPSGERRHLTVMFCDLVGSTELSTRLDIEDLQEVISAYQKRVTEVVTGFGGFVARRMGDGVLVYFGYPQAEEDDPEQAVRSGLAVVEAVAHLQGSEPLRVRVGIATGLMVVDDSSDDQEVLGVGEWPNLAARLQALAEPNTIVIADSTRRLVGSVFEIEDLGSQPLKGFAEPQRCWRVLGASEFNNRFETLRSVETPLIGRDEEVELLLRRWAQAKAGNGRVVLLCAEPGIGKSRLTVALRDRIGTEPHIALRHSCSPHHQDSALFPMIAQLERAAGFRREDAPAAKLDKLEALLAPASPTAEDLALIAELLLLPTGRYPALDLTPRRKKEKTFEALLRQLAGLSRHNPVVSIFEDLQWIDPTTRELLDLTVERVEHLPVLLVATFRPEFQPPWAGQPHVTTLILNRISRREAEALVRQLIGSAVSLPNDIVDEIVERADGVPLFLEEVTKAVVETGASLVGARGVLSGIPGSVVSIPPILHASLMARLERLGAVAKEIAEIGAAIGREFSYELLAIVAQQPEPELKGNLGRLVEAGLLFRHGELPRADFQFKHALLQDAAYSTLLRGPRRRLHARIAQALEEMFPDTAASRPELIAHHLSEAGLGERATLYWQRAGELALRRSAAGEALTHLSSALRILEGLADTPERARQELDVRLLLGTTLNTARGSSFPDVAEHYGRAVTLGRALGDDKLLFRAVWGSWYNTLTTGRSEPALLLANELVEVAERVADQDLLLEAYHSRWGTTHVLGFNSATLADTERGIASYDPHRHHVHAYHYGGHDTGVCARAHSAVTLWITGFPEQAKRMSDAALELGHRLGHPPSVAHAAWWSATLRQLLRDPEKCRELAELTIRIAHEQRSNIFMMCPLLVGWTMFESGEVAQGLQRMEQAITSKRQRVHRFYYDYELLVFASALLDGGEPGRALEVVDEALQFIATSRNRLFEAEAYRLKGACLTAPGGEPAAEAEAWLLRAIETANQQGALSLELRAARDLARIRRDQSQRREARDLLAQIYDRFTEGLDTPDLKDAKELLQGMQTAGPQRS